MVAFSTYYFTLITMIIFLSSCSNHSYFSKEGQTASAACYSCPWSKGQTIPPEDVQDVTLNGANHIAQTTITGNLTINGTATLDAVTLKQSLIVHGTAQLKSSTIHNNVTVHGTIDLDTVTIMNNAIIFGLLHAQNSTLHNMEIHCDDCTIKLDRCTVGAINIKGHAAAYNTPITLELNDTTVAGNICFINCIGKVIRQGSTTIQGSIQGETPST